MPSTAPWATVKSKRCPVCPDCGHPLRVPTHITARRGQCSTTGCVSIRLWFALGADPHADVVKQPTLEVAATMRRLLHASWRDIEHRWDQLTETEKACCTQDEHTAVLAHMQEHAQELAETYARIDARVVDRAQNTCHGCGVVEGGPHGEGCSFREFLVAPEQHAEIARYREVLVEAGMEPLDADRCLRALGVQL